MEIWTDEDRLLARGQRLAGLALVQQRRRQIAKNIVAGFESGGAPIMRDRVLVAAAPFQQIAEGVMNRASLRTSRERLLITGNGVIDAAFAHKDLGQIDVGLDQL